MKKIKLRKWVKVCITVLVVITSLFVYLKSSGVGELAQNSKVYEFICILMWVWLLGGQFIVYAMIWSNNK